VASPLIDIVTTGKIHSSLLTFASISLSDQACENVQKQADWHYTDFVLSSKDGGPDGKALACGTAQCFIISCEIQPEGWWHPNLTTPASGTAAAMDSSGSQMT